MILNNIALINGSPTFTQKLQGETEGTGDFY